MITEVLYALLGVSLPVLGAALVAAAVRRMLRHSVCLWGNRTTLNECEGYEYRFAIQNLESVPIDDEVLITVSELDQEESSHPTDPLALQNNIRVYSGQTRPEFLPAAREKENKPARIVKTIRFPGMPPYDTWTLKVVSLAKRVDLSLTPRDLPLGRLNPFRPWIAITLSAYTLSVRGDGPVSKGEYALPTWSTAAAVAAIGPFLYLVGFWLLWIIERRVESLNLVGSFSWMDLGVVIVLGLAGIAWYQSIRRPVYPTIQSYHMYWTETSDHLQSEEYRESRGKADGEMLSPAAEA